ncbi:thioesterase family protein [Halolamina litorea]|nr:PaaI family thioesterase [Halolamina litorea]
MELTEILAHMPFANLVGIDITTAEQGLAEGNVEMRNELSSVPGREIAHGGVTSSLADTVGGAAVMSLFHQPTPTVDLRIDYLSPATDDLYAKAEVIREGGNVAVVNIDINDADDNHVATARGVYKTGDVEQDTPWLQGTGGQLSDHVEE